MSNSPVCTDANLIVRLVAFPDSQAVQDLWQHWKQEDRMIIAPGLVLYEVTNALYQYLKHHVLSADTVSYALETALQLPVQMVDDREVHRRAMALARRYRLPAAHDAHYLAVAEVRQAELWTTDRKLFDACQQDWIKLVE